jgi:hypothetical protein
MLCAIFEYVSMGINGKNIYNDIDFHAVLDSEVYYFVSSVNENPLPSSPEQDCGMVE